MGSASCTSDCTSCAVHASAASSQGVGYKSNSLLCLCRAVGPSERDMDKHGTHGRAAHIPQRCAADAGRQSLQRRRRPLLAAAQRVRLTPPADLVACKAPCALHGIRAPAQKFTKVLEGCCARCLCVGSEPPMCMACAAHPADCLAAQLSALHGRVIMALERPAAALPRFT